MQIETTSRPRPSFASRVIITSVFVALAVTVAAGAATFDRDAAYTLLNQRSGANRANFYVYVDADSAFNHGSPSGFFGATGKVHLDVACVDDASAANGCSTDHARLDRLHVNAMRITFDALSAAERAGVTIEEPAQWSTKRSGQRATTCVA